MNIEEKDDSNDYGWVAAFGLASLLFLFMFDWKLGLWWVFYGLWKGANEHWDKKRNKNTNSHEDAPQFQAALDREKV